MGQFHGQEVKLIPKADIGLSHTYYTSYYQTIISDDQIWFNVGYGDLARYDILNDIFYILDESSCTAMTNTNNNIYPLKYSGDTLLFHYKLQGLYSYVKSTNTLVNINTAPWSTNFIENNGAYWHNTDGESGLHKELNGANYIYDSSNSEIPDTTISRLAVGNNGEIWVLYRGALGKFDGIDYLQYDFTESFSFSTDPLVLTMRTDFQGNVWVLNYGEGLLKFDGTDFTLFNSSNSSLPTNNISDLVADSLGNIWITDHQGNIIKYDGNNFSSYNYSSPVGLVSAAGYSINIDSNNNKWITTGDGLIVYNENQIQGPLGVYESLYKESTISIYPNPTGDLIKIKLDESEVLNQIQLYNVLGELILSEKTSNPQLNVQNITSGCYLVKVNTSQGLKHCTFLKK